MYDMQKIIILKNKIEKMASEADDKGYDSFLINLTVSDAFEICKWLNINKEN